MRISMSDFSASLLIFHLPWLDFFQVVCRFDSFSLFHA
ncbi:hypothetical protein GLYMA_20G006851v4 [Glycine max]|nr:hypothetical protein GLYMA_20G006851v4 [Glycine max]KAH1033953.1 hypothetical protein GYH30_054381 [Glycine max]